MYPVSYYVKSKLVTKNTTIIRLSSDENLSTGLWYRLLHDSQGWQTILLPLSKNVDAVTLSFEVYQIEAALTAVAFDDIVIDQCNSFIPTTTTIVPTSTLSTSTIITSTSETSTMSTNASTISTSTSTITPPNNANPLLSFNIYSVIIHFLLFQNIRQVL